MGLKGNEGGRLALRGGFCHLEVLRGLVVDGGGAASGFEFTLNGGNHEGLQGAPVDDVRQAVGDGCVDGVLEFDRDSYCDLSEG